ncbi:MAG: endonuclease domain-containing protein [Ignavibacteria bacterium]|nr:endonuclease domain-containing protein [Ignavibacteria bacterium]
MTEIFNRSEFKQTRKDLRNNPTKAEALLWTVLKGKKLDGNKFRRQYGVGIYVIDFYCTKKKLAVEIDGEVHDSKESREHDIVRDKFIRQFGIRILRFSNEDVERNIKGVLERILKELNLSDNHPLPPTL